MNTQQNQPENERQPWEEPVFMQVSMKDAMSGGGNFDAGDIGTLSS